MEQKSINEKSTELFKLLAPHRNTSVFQRIQILCVNRTGKKVTDFLANGASDEDKHKLLDELLKISRAGDWDKLPTAAEGQTSATPQPAAVAPAAPTPKPAPAAKPAPALAPTPAAKPAALPKPVDPTPAAVEPGAETLPESPAEDDPIAQALALMKKAVEQRKTPAAPAVTDEHIRKVARAELAAVFRTIADVLDKQQ